MVKKSFQLTKEGMAELKHELADLIKQRPEVAERIKTAREFGDLSENAEYQSAREEQQKNEDRINEVEDIIQNAEIIKKTKGDNKVTLGSSVKLKSASGIRDFMIVGTVEADPMAGKISDESPIGQALLGKSVGESVEIVAAGSKQTYQVTEIT